MAVRKVVKDNGLLRFSEQSREELIEAILDREKQLAEKDKRIRELEKKLKEKEKAEARQRELRFSRLQRKKKRANKPGQKPGHVGVTRIRPRHIDRVVEQTLEVCPDCNHPLSASLEVIEHTQEDIIPARVEVTLFKRHRYFCKCCGQIITAGYAPDEIPNGRIGPHALIHMAILKYHHALPGNKIVELFKELAGLEISEGAIAQALQRLAHWLQVEVHQILEAIRQSPQIHIDETGWKVNGRGHWLWAFVNERLTYYKIDPSRGAKVPRRIIPTDYGGTIVSDFYAVYNKLPGKKQKCLVHLLRELKTAYQQNQTQEFLKAHKRLKRIVNDAIRLGARQEAFGGAVFLRRIAKIKKRLLHWSLRSYRNKHLKRLSDRFLKYWFDLVTFLEEPGVSFNNNLCERQIRHNVIIRNRSYQNRSVQGANTHEVLMSLLQTLRLQHLSPVAFLKQAYLAHRQGNSVPLLSLGTSKS
jgi:transposase